MMQTLVQKMDHAKPTSNHLEYTLPPFGQRQKHSEKSMLIVSVRWATVQRGRTTCFSAPMIMSFVCFL